MFMVKPTKLGFKYWSHKEELEYLSDALDLVLGMEFDEKAYTMLKLINKRLNRSTRNFEFLYERTLDQDEYTDN